MCYLSYNLLFLSLPSLSFLATLLPLDKLSHRLSKKSWPILYSKLWYEIGQDLLWHIAP